MTADAEAVLQALNLPYRVIGCAQAILGLVQRGGKILNYGRLHKRSGWKSPHVQTLATIKRVEQHSHRNEEGKVAFVHTLNGSGVALPRLVIALLENGQQADGSIVLPDTLAPYMRGNTVLTAETV